MGAIQGGSNMDNWARFRTEASLHLSEEIATDWTKALRGQIYQGRVSTELFEAKTTKVRVHKKTEQTQYPSEVEVSLTYRTQGFSDLMERTLLMILEKHSQSGSKPIWKDPELLSLLASQYTQEYFKDSDTPLFWEVEAIARTHIMRGLLAPAYFKGYRDHSLQVQRVLDVGISHLGQDPTFTILVGKLKLAEPQS